MREKELLRRFANEPLAKYLAIELTELSEGSAVMEMSVSDELLIVGGIAQGGVGVILADFCAVYAAMSSVPSGHTPAFHMDIDLVRPILPEDGLMVARATTANVTARTVIVDVTVEQQGVLRTRGSIIFMRPKK